MKKAAMKASKAMKAKKSMKKKVMKVSKIGKGKFAKSAVFKGRKEKTVGGLTKSSLLKNKRGKVVSKKSSASGKRAYVNIKGWTSSVITARKALDITGFVAINGKSSQGKALYAKSKALYTSR